MRLPIEILLGVPSPHIMIVLRNILKSTVPKKKVNL